MGELATPDNPIDDLPVIWQSSLVTDVALGVDEDAICEAYGIQHHHLRKIKEDPRFRTRLEKLAEELQKEGMSFRLKAQMQAEELLRTSFAMIHDENVDPKVRSKLIADTVRWAGWDNSKAEDAGSRGGTGITINIDLGSADKAVDGRVFENEN